MSEADENGWMPIETAPKDGTPVDLWCSDDGRRSDCWYYRRQWLRFTSFGPMRVADVTHWRFIPKPPVKP